MILSVWEYLGQQPSFVSICMYLMDGPKINEHGKHGRKYRTGMTSSYDMRLWSTYYHDESDTKANFLLNYVYPPVI